MATSDDSATESNDLDVNNLRKELVKLRQEILRRDKLHREESRKAKEEFGVALAGVRHELQTLTDSSTTAQSHPEACYPNHHDEILREIKLLRDAISPSFSPVPRPK